MRRAIALARQVATSDAPVLLTGESGSGRNVLARAIHAWSSRRSAPFRTVSCAALAGSSPHDPLFTRMRSAFTSRRHDPWRFEAARGGTVFLDEVGDLPIDAQRQLVCVLAQRFERAGARKMTDLGARVIPATKRDLEAEIRAGRFREDLFFRLSVVAIAVPPLREHDEDIRALTDHLLAALALRYRRERLRVAPETWRILHAYRWPGNVRELANALEHAVVLSKGDMITADHLPSRVRSDQPITHADVATPPDSLARLEREYITRIVADSATLDQAASRPGINLSTLWRKRKRWGLG